MEINADRFIEEMDETVLGRYPLTDNYVFTKRVVRQLLDKYAEGVDDEK